MTLVRGGIKVRPHVQAFVDACAESTGADNYGTYNGHEPSADLAVDIFHQVGDDRLADKICDFALKNLTKYGVDYVISRQRIYNPEIATYWRNMEDRGGFTQNHRDHVHVSFEPSAPVVVEKPKPVIDKERAMSMYVRFRFQDQTPGRVGKLDYIFDGPSHILAPVGSMGVLKAADKTGCVELGDIEQGDWDWFKGVESGWRNG